MSEARYLAIKDGWIPGKGVIKKDSVFTFSGPRGSWMVPCDGNGKPLDAQDAPVAQRPVRAGKATGAMNRQELRAKCKELGISFAATASAIALADLIRKHEEEADAKEAASSENPDGGDPGVGTGGVGEQEVL